MTYVISDLHGEYGKYIEMLELIGFREDDVLYLLGDICDRGDGSEKLYLDIMARDNVFCIKGNHEQMLEEALQPVFGWLRDSDEKNSDDGWDVVLWSGNGGDSTMESFCRLNDNDISRIYRFVKELPAICRSRWGKRTSLWLTREDVARTVREYPILNLSSCYGTSLITILFSETAKKSF